MSIDVLVTERYGLGELDLSAVAKRPVVSRTLFPCVFSLRVFPACCLETVNDVITGFFCKADDFVPR